MGPPAGSFPIARQRRSIVGNRAGTVGQNVLRVASLAAVLWMLATGSSSRCAGAKRPNVLLIVADDLNDWTAPLGGHPQARTPNLDRLAARGMLFTNAHCNYALCNPSRASMLTGRLPSSTGVYKNEHDWRKARPLRHCVPLPQYFRQHGYWTAAAGKVFHANHGGPAGSLVAGHGGRQGFNHPPSWNARYPSHQEQIPDLVVRTGQNFNGLDIWHWDWGPIDCTDAATADGRCAQWVVEQLEARHDRPFLIALGVYATHGPWYCPRPYFDLYPLDQVRLPLVKEDDLDDVPEVATGYARWSGNYHQLILRHNLWHEAVQAYLTQVSFADATVGRVLRALERSPYADNTIICLLSDHGWYLGEKRRWHKGGLWEEATRVPLVFVVPGLTEPGAVCTRAVSLVDLYPTLVELCGLPPRDDLEGTSLVPLLGDPERPWEKPVVIASGGGRRASYAVRTERWRYIRYYDGSEELYDHLTDACEWFNLADKPQYARLKQQLARWIPQQFAPFGRRPEEIPVEHLSNGATRYRLEDGDELPADRLPNMAAGFRLSARLTPRYPDGTVVTWGNGWDGWVVYLDQGKLSLTVCRHKKKQTIAATEPATGTFRIVVLVAHKQATLQVDGRTVAEGRLSLRLPGKLDRELVVGLQSSVLDIHRRIPGFLGTLEEVVLEVPAAP